MHPATSVHAPNGLVCSVDHLASSAGVAMLRAGGTAADAAVAASAVLAVTSQHMCGMGGDLWALVHTGTGPPTALCAAGRAGSGSDPGALRGEGHTHMPFRRDVRSAPVPGCVDGWVALHERYGRLTLDEVLAPAAGYAADGFPASPLLCLAVLLVTDVPGADDYLRTPLHPGARVRRPLVADVLRAVGDGGRDAFYRGAFGGALIELGAGLYSEADLAASQADWVQPISLDVWGRRLWTVPPPSQGYLTLSSAALVGPDRLPEDPEDAGWAHLLVEASRWAAYDRLAVLHEHADAAALLAPERLGPRRASIDPERATAPLPTVDGGDTIYLCAADSDGMGVSLIQSNAADWGAHLVVPGTGIFLHNRGIGFRLEPGHPAGPRPGARPPHTLAPALVTSTAGDLVALVGTMGGDNQPQVVLQLLARLLVNGQTPGQAVAAPRWSLGDGGFATWEAGEGKVRIEHDAPVSWEEGLPRRGHRVERTLPGANLGHAHAITVSADGTFAGAADPRAEVGAAQGW